MEDTKEKIRKPKTWHDIDIKGRWKLTYTVRNSQGPSAFGGYHIGTYPNPFTGEKTFLRTVDNEALRGFMMDKLGRQFLPDEDQNDKFLVSWLICSPEVKVEGVENLDPIILKKKTAGKLTLTYLDAEQTNKLDDEDYIDKLIGILSLDKGVNALGLSKLRYVMAYLGMNYREPRFEADTEKKSLRSKLKTQARKSVAKAKEIYNAIDNMNDAQDVYEFKESVRLRIIVFTNGVYKFNGTPIGRGFDQATAFFNSHPEVKTEVLTLLYKQIT